VGTPYLRYILPGTSARSTEHQAQSIERRATSTVQGTCPAYTSGKSQNRPAVHVQPPSTKGPLARGYSTSGVLLTSYCLAAILSFLATIIRLFNPRHQTVGPITTPSIRFSRVALVARTALACESLFSALDFHSSYLHEFDESTTHPNTIPEIRPFQRRLPTRIRVELIEALH
jgi:hypothetical protein